MMDEYVHGPATPDQWKTCERCNYAVHQCPGCGEWLYHGTNVCGPCRDEAAED